MLPSNVSHLVMILGMTFGNATGDPVLNNHYIAIPLPFDELFPSSLH